GLGKTYWYNTNVPSFTTFAAGELFLGTYSYDGTEHRVDGTEFCSRPSSIEFDYTYTPIGDDRAYVKVFVLNSSNEVISSSETTITGSKDKFSLDLPDYKFGEKAAKLSILFRSSSSENPQNFVHIPQGSELDEGFGALNFGDKNLGDNNYHAVATGSVLIIDNVKAIYKDGNTSTPSNAPKRKTTKRK
ncbi:MAG: hypothetical protein K2G13_08615, partial [Muribaculaceae bacterium]|nr:hypothetical protein [Muribaculaceae bacterium]